MFECPCGRQETATRVSSCVDVAVLTYPVIRLGLYFMFHLIIVLVIVVSQVTGRKSGRSLV